MKISLLQTILCLSCFAIFNSIFWNIHNIICVINKSNSNTIKNGKVIIYHPSNINYHIKNTSNAEAETTTNSLQFVYIKYTLSKEQQEYNKRIKINNRNISSLATRKRLYNAMEYNNSFIISIRNPIQRFIQIINEEQNNNRDIIMKSINFFGGTIDKLMTNGLVVLDSNHNTSDANSLNNIHNTTIYYYNNVKSCQNRVRRWITMNYFPKLSYEYSVKELLQKLPSKVNIFILRSEYFMIDWKTLHDDDYYHQNQDFLHDTLYTRHNDTNTNTTNPKIKKISQKGLNNICKILCSEIQIYKELLHRAVNLKDKDKIDSLNDLHRTCPNILDVSFYCISATTPSNNNTNEADTSGIDAVKDNNALLKFSLSTRRIAFIHIGKTGGSTAGSMIRRKCTLPSDIKCQQYVLKNEDNSNKFIPYETQISRQVQEYFHVRKPNIHKYNSFIVTARNPIHRLVSWFLHNHPRNKITRINNNSRVYRCYVQIDDLATNGLNTDINDNHIINNETKHKCQIEARIFIREHLKYKAYTRELLQPKYNTEKEIFVLRKEHFWNDWQTINTMLGGGTKKPINKVDSITHYECTMPQIVNRTISKNGIQNLCYFLCTDIQLYKQLLERGINLNEDDKKVSWIELNKTCPVETNREDCHYKMKYNDN